MLTRLEVDGFKSLSDFAVDFGPLTALIGPNGAGKSNVLEALALLSRLSSESIEDAFRGGRGRSLDQFARRGTEAAREIRFAVEVAAPAISVGEEGARWSKLRYELIIGRHTEPSGIERLLVEDERVVALDYSLKESAGSRVAVAETVHESNQAVELARQTTATRRHRRIRSASNEIFRVPSSHTAIAALFAGLQEWLFSVSLPAEVVVIMDQLKEQHALRSRSEVLSRALRALSESEQNEMTRSAKGPEALPWDCFDAVGRELRGFRLFHVDASRLREPSERVGSETIAPDASNLPTVLAGLDDVVFGEIRADVASLVPGIGSVHVVRERDDFRLEFELSGGERLPARLASNGTLRILALLATLLTMPTPAFLAIEEPENGIHPARFRTLLRYLHDATVPLTEGIPTLQVVVATHSPVAVSTMRAEPEHLRLVDLVRRDGRLVSRVRPVTRAATADRGHTIASIRELDDILRTERSEPG